MEENNIKKVMFNANNKKHKEFKLENKPKEKDRKRIETENWIFTQEEYAYENQLAIIKDLFNNDLNHTNYISKIILQQINKKIYGYKHQDIIKKLFLEQEFITLPSIINKMIECNLKCYYCQIEMNVLYDISREASQWTVDRINNDLGHNINNFYLACLDCNLKRRCRNDAKFLFTKQLKITKQYL
jgi:hypothetical protein